MALVAAEASVLCVAYVFAARGLSLQGPLGPLVRPVLFGVPVVMAVTLWLPEDTSLAARLALAVCGPGVDRRDTALLAQAEVAGG